MREIGEWQLVTGMSTACFYGDVYNEIALREIGEMGIHHAEVFFSAQMEYRREFTRGLRQTCADYGIHMASIHAMTTQFEPQLFSLHGRQVDEAMDVYKRVLDAAHYLGAEIYVFHGPVHLKVAKKPNINMQYAGERVHMLAELAKQAGIKLCFETVHWCWYSYPGFAAELLRHAYTDNLYFTLDMKQAAQSGHPAEAYVRDMQGRLAHVHVCDYIRDAARGVVPCLPFEGETDWAAFRTLLDKVEYNGALMLEVYAGNYSSYAQLRGCYQRVADFFAKDGTE